MSETLLKRDSIADAFPQVFQTRFFVEYPWATSSDVYINDIE